LTLIVMTNDENAIRFLAILDGTNERGGADTEGTLIIVGSVIGLIAIFAYLVGQHQGSH